MSDSTSFASRPPRVELNDIFVAMPSGERPIVSFSYNEDYPVERINVSPGMQGFDDLRKRASLEADALVAAVNDVKDFDALEPGQMATFLRSYNFVLGAAEILGDASAFSYYQDTAGIGRELAWPASQFVSKTGQQIAVLDQRIAEMDQGRLEQMANDPVLEGDARWLLTRHEKTQFQLSPEDENRYGQLTGQNMKRFSSAASGLKYHIDGDEVSFPELRGMLRSSNPDQRAIASNALYEATRGVASSQASNLLEYMSAVYDEVTDRLEVAHIDGKADPVLHYAAVRYNGIAPEMVENAMEAAVASLAEINQKYYAAKAQLMGVDKLSMQNMSATVTPEGETLPDRDLIPYGLGAQMLMEVCSDLSPGLGVAAQGFLGSDANRVDADPEGANRSSYAGYLTLSPLAEDGGTRLIMTYLGSLDDFGTLAHEGGHALASFTAAQEQGTSTRCLRRDRVTDETWALVIQTTAASAASTILGEENPAVATTLAMQAFESNLENAMLGVTRFLFEQELYRKIGEAKEQGKDVKDYIKGEHEKLEDALADIQVGVLKKIYPGLEIGEDQHYQWARVGHYTEPFYNFSYTMAVFGAALVSQEHEKAVVRGEQEAFGGKLYDYFASGSSRSYKDTMAVVGVDVMSPQCWQAACAQLMKETTAITERMQEQQQLNLTPQKVAEDHEHAVAWQVASQNAVTGLKEVYHALQIDQFIGR